MEEQDWPELVRLAREGKHEPLIVALQRLQALRRAGASEEVHSAVLDYLEEQNTKSKRSGRPAHSEWYIACMKFAVKQWHPMMQAGMDSGTMNGYPLKLLGIPGDKEVSPGPMDAAIVAVADANNKSPSMIRKIVYSKKSNKR